MYGIPWRLIGGTAARLYGASRALRGVDIDTTRAGIAVLTEYYGAESVTMGPAGGMEYRDDNWDLFMTRLRSRGIDIAVCDSASTRIRRRPGLPWRPMAPLARRQIIDVRGLGAIPVIPKDDLVRYKRIIGRECDLADLEEIAPEPESFPQFRVRRFSRPA